MHNTMPPIAKSTAFLLYMRPDLNHYQLVADRLHDCMQTFKASYSE